MNNLDLPLRTKPTRRKNSPQPQFQPQLPIDQTFPPPVFVEISARLREAALLATKTSSYPQPTRKDRSNQVSGVFLGLIALLCTLTGLFVLQLLLLPLLVIMAVGLAFLSGSWWGRQGSAVLTHWKKQRKLARLRAMHRRGDG